MKIHVMLYGYLTPDDDNGTVTVASHAIYTHKHLDIATTSEVI